MYSALVAAAFVASAAASYNAAPPCWQGCFSKYQAETECLCSDSVSDIVAACVSSGCSAANSTAAAGHYGTWLSSYCNEHVKPPTTTSEVVKSYTTVCPITSGTQVKTTTSTVISSYTTECPVSSYPVVTKETTKTLTTTVPCTTVVTEGEKTKTSTYVTTSTYTTCYDVTKTPYYNTWTSHAASTGPATYPAVTPSVSATKNVTGPAPTYTAPYTGGAGAVQVGAFGAAAVAVAGMLL